MEEMALELDLPGFRFHPTEEELLDFYLKNMVYGKKLRFDIIRYLNIYHYDPSELPGLARNGEREWYFFVPRDRRHGSGGRPNRTTANGFWKATGSDRKIVSLSDPKRVIGLRKTLVFYKGRAPRGSKTDWVMNEYRLPDSCPLPKDIVLCKIYRKATSLKVLEQRAAREEEEIMKTNINLSPSSSPPSPSSLDNMSFCGQQEDPSMTPPVLMHQQMVFKKEIEDMVILGKDHNGNISDNIINTRDENAKEITKGSSLKLPFGKEKLSDLEVSKLSIDHWSQDNFWLNSPWLQNLMTPYANILNF